MVAVVVALATAVALLLLRLVLVVELWRGHFVVALMSLVRSLLEALASDHRQIYREIVLRLPWFCREVVGMLRRMVVMWN